MAKIRAIVHYGGRVQGVGFRYTTRYISGRFDVTGYVQNLSDGRVRLEAEGHPREVDSFLEAVQGEFQGKITSNQRDDMPADGEFEEFAIRY